MESTVLNVPILSAFCVYRWLSCLGEDIGRTATVLYKWIQYSLVTMLMEYEEFEDAINSRITHKWNIGLPLSLQSNNLWSVFSFQNL